MHVYQEEVDNLMNAIVMEFFLCGDEKVKMHLYLHKSAK